MMDRGVSCEGAVETKMEVETLVPCTNDVYSDMLLEDSESSASSCSVSDTMSTTLLTEATTTTPDEEEKELSVFPIASGSTSSSVGATTTKKDTQFAPRLSFPLKLYDMLEDAEDKDFSSIVSWNSDGDGFMVHDTSSFVKNIIPSYYNQVVPTPA
jgi:hypothetical protein